MASFSNTSIILPSPHRHLPVLPLRFPNLVNSHSFRFNQQQFRYFSKNPTISAALVPIRVSSADLDVQDLVSTSITSSWAQFAEKVSGEWDGFGAGFTADGQPVELPQQVVPEAYREPFSVDPFAGASDTIRSIAAENLFLIDLDPATAKVAISILGPFLSAFGFLFIVRIVMSWYPKLPVEKFPYVVAYAPTEPILAQTRKVIPPLGGVDVTPVVWFGLLSFLNEILVGPQGLLVLLSQKV